MEAQVKVRTKSLLVPVNRSYSDDIAQYPVDYKSFLILVIEAYYQTQSQTDKAPLVELLKKIDLNKININQSHSPVYLTEKDLYWRLFPYIENSGKSLYPLQSKSLKDAALEAIQINNQAAYLQKEQEINPNMKPMHRLVPVPGVNILDVNSMEEYQQRVNDILDEVFQNRHKTENH